MESHGILFCKECKNCLRPTNKTTKSGKTKLAYYCQKCSTYYNKKSKKKMVIYNISYQNDSISKYTENDYLKYDPTIPHLKSMSCINVNCASNLKCNYSINFQYFKNKTELTDSNFEEELTLQLNNDLEKFRTSGLIVKNIGRNLYYVILTNVNDNTTDEECKNMMSEIYTYLMNKTQTKNISSEQEKNTIAVVPQFTNVEKVVKNEKDILFVKYDSVNMRYLYKCCVCATYWKNKE